MESKIHFIHSGNGDTILIESEGEWGLVDGNFVKALDVEQRVLALLNGAKRLRFVCITHFDLDHIRGLGAFLTKHFSDDDGKGGKVWRVNQVLTPLSPTRLELLAAMKKDAETRPPNQPFLKRDVSGEAVELLRVLCDMLADTYKARRARKPKQAIPEFICMAPRAELFGLEKVKPLERGIGSWRCFSLGPSDRTSEIYANQMTEFFAGRGKSGFLPQVDNNDVSRVLALVHKKTKDVVLLTGDSTPDELRSVLTEWKRLAADISVSGLEFQGMKVSHHGAETCHVPDIYSVHCTKDGTKAIICAQDDGEHPHQDVISCLVKSGIEYRVTGEPPASNSTTNGIGVPLGSPTTPPGGQDIVFSFNGDSLVSVGGRLSHLHEFAQLA